MNGETSHSKESLERALEGKDAETRARTLTLMQEMGIAPDDPLFLFTAALAQFETLVIAAPRDWEALFALFRADLERWNTNHTQTLMTAEAMTDAIGRMTDSLNAVYGHADILLIELRNADTQSPAMKQLSAVQETILNTLDARLDGWMEEHRREMQALRQLVSQHARPPAAAPPGGATDPFPHLGSSQTRPSRKSSSPALSLLIGALLPIAAGVFWMVHQQRQPLTWLVIQTHRSDCQQGVLPASSPQCRMLDSSSP